MTNHDDILCQYQAGEERGVQLLKQLRTFAPNEEIAKEIDQQIIDEEKHDRLFAERLADLDIDCEGLNNSLVAVYDLAQECVDQKDWVSSIAIQTIIEELAMSTFTQRLPDLDEKSQEVLKEIISDEARHLEFGIRELEKIASGNEEKIRALHLKVMKILKNALESDEHTEEELGFIMQTVTKGYRMHRSRMAKIGLEVPEVSELLA